jgi:hypothetical protein
MIKNLLIVVLIGLVTGCKDTSSSSYTLKGKLLKSCANGQPIRNFKLDLVTQDKPVKSPVIVSAVTDVNGEFQFTYSTLYGNLCVQGTHIDGQGNQVYLSGIPVNQNINAGEIYADSNFYFIVKINPLRQTSSADTIYYHQTVDSQIHAMSFARKICGPFSVGQIIDTMVMGNSQFYDIANESKYQYKTQEYYQWKLGHTGKTQITGGIFPPCFKYNSFTIDIQ